MRERIEKSENRSSLHLEAARGLAVCFVFRFPILSLSFVYSSPGQTYAPTIERAHEVRRARCGRSGTGRDRARMSLYYYLILLASCVLRSSIQVRFYLFELLKNKEVPTSSQKQPTPHRKSIHLPFSIGSRFGSRRSAVYFAK